VTRRATIPQADIERVISAAARRAPGSRVIVDLARQRVEIVLASSDSQPRDSQDDDNPWDEDHGPA